MRFAEIKNVGRFDPANKNFWLKDCRFRRNFHTKKGKSTIFSVLIAGTKSTKEKAANVKKVAA